MTKYLARLLAALLALAMLAAACGDDDDDEVGAGGPVAEADEADSDSDDDATDDGAMGDDDHDGDAMDDDHSHSEAIEVPEAMAVPEISIELFEDPKAGHNLQVSVDSFTLAPEHASTDPIDGEGHLHLYIDGQRVARFYNEWMHIDGLDPGEHTVMVEVSANNHSAYAVDGTPITAMATIDVPESEMSHSHAEVIDLDPAEAPTISIEVTPDPEAGWNLHVTELTNFTLTPANASTDPVDGEGHMHLYIDGERIGRLYGTWWHIKALSEGEHTIEVEVSANNHSPYAIDGEAIRAMVTLDVPAELATETSMEDDMAMGNDPAAADEVIEVTFADGSVEGVSDRISLGLGSLVAIVATSDVAEHLHVHGYDVFAALMPGEEAVAMFTADIPGVFEVELEDSGAFLFEIEVS